MSNDPGTLPSILRYLELLDEEGQHSVWIWSISPCSLIKNTMEQTSGNILGVFAVIQPEASRHGKLKEKIEC
jgi:hypothetical protein